MQANEFIVGSRYRNRDQGYEVLEIQGDQIHVRCDDQGHQLRPQEYGVRQTLEHLAGQSHRGRLPSHRSLEGGQGQGQGVNLIQKPIVREKTMVPCLSR